jgi:hypothetical protein
LEVAHGTATRRSVLDTGAGGHGPQSRRRGLVQERAHGPGLTEEGLHVGWRGQKEANWRELGVFVVSPAMIRREGEGKQIAEGR